MNTLIEQGSNLTTTDALRGKAPQRTRCTSTTNNAGHAIRTAVDVLHYAQSSMLRPPLFVALRSGCGAGGLLLHEDSVAMLLTTGGKPCKIALSAC